MSGTEVTGSNLRRRWTSRASSLKTKVLVSVVALVIIASGSLTGFSLYQTASGLFQDLLAQGISDSVSLSKLSRFGVLTEDSSILEGIVSTTMGDTNVASVTIFNADRKIIASSEPALVGTMADDFLLKQTLLRLSSANDVKRGDLFSRVAVRYFYENVYAEKDTGKYFADEDTQISTKSQSLERSSLIPIGAVRVGISLQPTRTKMKHVLIFSVAVFLIVSVLSAIVASIAIDKMLRPVLAMSRASSEISAGNFAVELEIDTFSDDEVGVLSQNFNAMIVRLNEYQDEIAEHTEQLERAKHRAEAANIAKSEFLAGMSHELRTPLNSILGYSEMLATDKFGALSEKQSRFVHNIAQSGDQLLNLVNDILDLSKVEAGREAIFSEEFDLIEILDDIRGNFSPQLNQKSHRWVRAYRYEEFYISADKRKVQQIINNLLSNAIKFTPQNGLITVDVQEIDLHHTMERYPEGTLGIKFSVQDDGIGIDPKDRDRVFNKFEQVDSSYSRDYQGTGLGLPLVKELVKLHGGLVDFEQNPDAENGSTFYFIIPRDQSVAMHESTDELDQSSDSETTHEGTRTPAEQQRKRVLVIEDDKTIWDFVDSVLALYGYQAIFANDGAEGAQLVLEDPPDIILLDLKLPKLSGFKLLERLTEIEITRKIPVVVISATPEMDTGYGQVCDWVVKPMNVRRLSHALDLAGHAAHGGSRA